MKLTKSLLIIFLLAAAPGCARKTTPAAPVTGNGNTADTISVLCYNIHHANPPSKPDVIDIAAIAGVINRQQPQLVALQEVDVHTTRSGSSLHQAEELARLTGMKAYFAKAIDYGGGEYGVAILSKLPMEGLRNTPLPTAEGTNGEHRTLATAVVTAPGGKKFVFAATHLDAQRADTNRVLQMNRILELLQQETLPVVLAGDLNAAPGTPTINLLDSYFTRSCTMGCPFTIPVINPTKTIDFISYAPKEKCSVLQHQVIPETYASDHLPVFAVFELK